MQIKEQFSFCVDNHNLLLKHVNYFLFHFRHKHFNYLVNNEGVNINLAEKVRYSVSL